MRSNSERFLVLDDGFVQVDGVFYSDSDITRIARVTSLKAGKTKFRDDKDLLSYFIREGHSSPFGFPQVNLYVRCPFTIREQWFRHRTGHRADVVESTDVTASLYHEQQQFSGRYAAYNTGYNIPSEDYMLKPSPTNNQTSSEELIHTPSLARGLMKDQFEANLHVYDVLINSYGLARERARWVLPFATYTEFYFQQNLWNLLDWLSKRRNAAAQKEIRAYANIIEGIVQENFPLTYAAWDDVVSGAKLTKTDVDELRELLANKQISGRLAKRLFGSV